ncbi:MAG TPA: Holliday junction resolvase RuvX [Williamwhitmania sp.]|nr:Holliday junction resolvase RuvX [Williamwhitmania sp.]
MGRIVGIDYGRKRVGVAITDTLQIVAQGITTVHSSEIIDYLKDYFSKEDVELVVVGYPRQMNNTPSEGARFVQEFLNRMKKVFPDMPVSLVDERFTSKIATRAILDSGAKKKERMNKELVDMVSASLILQSYLEARSYRKND